MALVHKERRGAPRDIGTAQPRFFTPAEVARMFRVSKMTVYRAIRDGDLPAVPMRGRWAVPARAIDSLERSALAHLDDYGDAPGESSSARETSPAGGV